METPVSVTRLVHEQMLYEHVACDLCGSIDTRTWLITRDRGYGRFVIVRCQECGLAFVNPRPNEQAISSYYADDYYAYTTTGRRGLARLKETISEISINVLSIIIVTWNTRELLAQCLDSVYANPPDAPFDVWVVDNASSDGSAAMVRQRFPHVHLIENGENVGFARANNQAIRASSGEYALLLNSDTIIQPGTLTRLLSFARQSGAAIVGADVRNSDGSPQPCFGRFPTVAMEILCALGLNARRPFARALHPPAPDGQETDWVLGAALLVRRAILDQVGLLDEGYFMFSEEVDLARRVKRAGGKVCVLGGARVVHLGQQSTRQISGAMKAELFRSKARYFRTHHGRLAAGVLGAVFGLSMLARMLLYRWRGKGESERVWAAAWRHWHSPQGSRP